MKRIFGRRLKEVRIKNEELQNDLATYLKVDISAISQWENGKFYPKVEKLIEIAYHYSISIDYLLGLKDEEKYKEEFSYNDGVHQINHRRKK